MSEKRKQARVYLVQVDDMDTKELQEILDKVIAERNPVVEYKMSGTLVDNAWRDEYDATMGAG